MTFQSEELGAALKIKLAGHLDAASIDRIETRLLAAIEPAGKNTIVDLSSVDFISSMGIRMLLRAAHALKRRQAGLVLVGAQPLVAASLNLAVGQTIPLVSTEREALERLSA